MKVEFNKEEIDNRVKFNDLKPGDTFTFGDPNACAHDVFLKIHAPKEFGTAYDCVNLSSGKLNSYYNFKREIITIDQELVYKVSAMVSVDLNQ